MFLYNSNLFTSNRKNFRTHTQFDMELTRFACFGDPENQVEKKKSGRSSLIRVLTFFALLVLVAITCFILVICGAIIYVSFFFRIPGLNIHFPFFN